MNEKEFFKLVELSESATIDFKKKIDYSNKVQKAGLLKDIISFANSDNESCSYIIVGIKEVSGSKILYGLDDENIIDDADLQQYVNGKLNKVVSFSVITLEAIVDGGSRKFQIIKIDSNQFNAPFFTRVNVENIVRKNIVYVRKGSSNDELNPEETIKRYNAGNTLSIDVEGGNFHAGFPVKEHIDYLNTYILLINTGSCTARNSEVEWHYDCLKIIDEINSFMSRNSIEGYIEYDKKTITVDIPHLNLLERLTEFHNADLIALDSITVGHSNCKKVDLPMKLSLLLFIANSLCASNETLLNLDSQSLHFDVVIRSTVNQKVNEITIPLRSELLMRRITKNQEVEVSISIIKR